MSKSNRRSFIARSATAAAAVGVAAVPASAQPSLTKRVIYPSGKKPEKPQLFSPIVGYGNLLFLSGIGAHFEGDIKAHTKHVLDEIQKNLEAAGSSMDKVLKCQVYLADLKDYDDMNEVFRGRFGSEPPVRTTIAAAGVPGKSLVEIDVIAYV
ncbi:MAG: RidA family protein [Acidobacteriaceae bacterium]|nr:RidA family protein [Acidobacteriaceae bacterium]